MTATQPDPDGGMTRRGVMRRTAIGVGAAATLGATATGGVAAINLPSRETVITAGGIAVSPPLWAAKQVYDRVTDPATGEDVNDELDSLNAEETHTSAREDLIYLKSVDDRVLTSIGNVVSGLDRRAYQTGIEKAITEMDAGAAQADVKSRAVDVAMESVAKTEKNLLDHYAIQVGKLRRLSRETGETSNLITTDVMRWYDDTGTVNGDGDGGYKAPGEQEETTSITLSDTTSYTYEVTSAYSDGAYDSAVDSQYGISNNVSYANTLRVQPVDTGSEETIFDRTQYANLWGDIQSIASTVETEINSWVDGIYSSYSSGDVNLDELVTADMLAATASEQNDLSNVTADFASLGIPINDRTTLTIEIVAGENSGTVIEGNLSVKNPPEDGFIVGDTYDPENITGPVWLMYDRTTDSGETEGDVYQLQNKFKVIDAEDYEGNPVSNVTFEEKTQERYSTDIEELNAQLDKLAEYQQEIQEERDALIEEEATGGGGGFLSGVAQGYSTGVLALGAAGVAWLLSKN